MSHALALPHRIRWGLTAGASTAMLSLLVVIAALMPASGLKTGLQHSNTATTTTAASTGGISPALTRVADKHPGERVEAIVQFNQNVAAAKAQRVSRAYGARVIGDLHVINGLAVRMRAGSAVNLAKDQRVHAVTLNHAVRQNGRLRTHGLGLGQVGSPLAGLLKSSYDASVQAPDAWAAGATGSGVGVAVIDTGIAGDLPDFSTSSRDSTSRVVASVATNPYAKNEGDSYGHGTHVAGIIAGNGMNRPARDSLHGDYAGIAPDADLVNVKIADENGSATVLDAIYGLQFIIDKKDDYNIRVANLSFESASTDSYKIDPLDAAAEAAWFNGIVVVAAAGNRGSASDAVKHAPGNDPYVITVGAADDHGTDTIGDDNVASWSSRGKTQDGYAKPDVVAPGARIVSTLAPDSDFASLCPTCIIGGQYIRASGTSMAAPVVAGAVADLLEAHPSWTPNQVKGVIMATDRSISGDRELSIKDALAHEGTGVTANAGLKPNTLIDPATGNIAYSRSSWSRSSWSRSSWSRSSWSCACSKLDGGSVDPTRSSWSRSSWSTYFAPVGAPAYTAPTPRAVEHPASSTPTTAPAKHTGPAKHTAKKRHHKRHHKKAHHKKRHHKRGVKRHKR
jgi:serine protease AprX